MNKPILARTLALVLAICAFAAVPEAKAKRAHVKKAAHTTLPPKKHQASGKPDTASSSWKPDAKLLSHLEPEKDFGDFSLRLPAGYVVEEHDMSTPEAHITGYLAKGPKRTEGSFPVIFIVVGTASSGYNTGSAEALLNGNEVINGKSDLVKSDFQDGEANGLQMVRQYFKYPLKPGSSRLLHGFHYATTDGQTDAIVAAMDAEPDNATTLPLAEASALTLHKTP